MNSLMALSAASSVLIVVALLVIQHDLRGYGSRIPSRGGRVAYQTGWSVLLAALAFAEAYQVAAVVFGEATAPRAAGVVAEVAWAAGGAR